MNHIFPLLRIYRLQLAFATIKRSSVHIRDLHVHAAHLGEQCMLSHTFKQFYNLES